MNSMPVGFRFRPTDEELVGHYLKHKLLGNDSIVHNVIAEVDVCKFEPWKLSALSVVKSDDQEWVFLCPRDYKYAKSKRFNRATECGFWKVTGNDRNIKTRGTDKVIGTKKTLVFYKGPVPGVKTNWVIHEYHDAVTFDESQRTFVLCRLMKKAEKKSEGGADTLTCDEGEPSRDIGSDYENKATVEGIPDVGGTMPEMDMEATFQAPYQADQYFPYSVQQFPVAEGSCLNSPFLSAYFGNENNIMQTLFETIDKEDEFMDSFPFLRDENNSMQALFETIDKEDEFMDSFPFLKDENNSMQTLFETIDKEDEFMDSFTFLKDENNSMQTLFETTKEPDEFVNSFLADVDVVLSGNIGYASVNDPTHSNSLRQVYYESSGTDAEVVSALVGGTLPEMDMEATFQAPYRADQYFPYSAQQFPVAIEQEGSSLNSPFLSAYVRNENNIIQTLFETIDEEDELMDSFACFRYENNSMQTPFETTKQQDEFVNSFLTDVDVVFSGNIGYASVNDPTHSKSLKRVYYESSDTDAEVVSALCGNTLDVSTISQEHLSSCEFHASKMSKSSHGAVHGGISFLSSNNDANRDKNESLFQDNFFGMETSSCDSTADKPLGINCIEISSSPSTPRKQKKQCHPRPATFVSQRAAARGSQQRNFKRCNIPY